MENKFKIALITIFAFCNYTFAGYAQAPTIIAEIISADGKKTVTLSGELGAETITYTETVKGTSKPLKINCQRKNALAENWYQADKDQNYYYIGSNAKNEWIIRFLKSNEDNNLKIQKKNVKTGELVETLEGKYNKPLSEIIRVLATVKSSESKSVLTIHGSIDSTSLRVTGIDRHGKKVTVVCDKRNAEKRTWYTQTPDQFYNFYYEKTMENDLWEIRFVRNKENNIEVYQKMPGNYKIKDTYFGVCSELHQLNSTN